MIIIFRESEFMAGSKYSRQRETIREYLKSTTSHPTADTVYRHVSRIIPRISLGTVYRNLNKMADNGEILRLNLGDGTEHFDATVTPHNHFICDSCGQVIDLNMKSIDEINEVAALDFNGIINGHFTYFYGKCPDCVNHSNVNHSN